MFLFVYFNDISNERLFIRKNNFHESEVDVKHDNNDDNGNDNH